MTRAARKWLYPAFGGLCLLLVLFFHQGLSSNPSSRLLTVYALVEGHSLKADRWRGETGDFAEIGGHTYSDKAPLASFVVLPFYWAARHFDRRPWGHDQKELAGHLGTVLAAGVPFAIFAVLLLARLLREGLRPRAAVWAALAAAFGTCIVNCGNTFFGHMLAGTLFLGSFILACELERDFVLAGFLGGCAVVTEYPLVLTQAAILGYLLLGPDRWRRASRYVLGAAPMAFLMFLYNHVVTGRWSDFPYSHVNTSWAAMRVAFGIRAPDPSAIWELLFGQFRGVAFYASILLLLLPALALRFPGPPRRRTLVFVILSSYLLFIGSYFMWNGGWCTGPRHLVPVIALAVYEGVGALAHMKRTGRLTFALLAAWGVVLSVCASATDSIPSDGIQHPAFEVFFRHIATGDLTPHNLLAELGFKIGGRLLLAPWFAILLGGALLLGWAAERRSAAARVTPPLPEQPTAVPAS
ncbi:MAG: glycosyltransferase family 39 protein [Myxococcales bacterium]